MRMDNPIIINPTPSPLNTTTSTTTPINNNPKQTSSTTSPIMDNLISSLVPIVGHDKALKYAFYNVLALLLAGLSIFSIWGVYCILEPFIKALLWALLFGSVLFPFKRRVVDLIQVGIERVKKSEVPFSLWVVGSPLVVADCFSDRIGVRVVENWKEVGGGLGVFFVSYWVYYSPMGVGVVQWLGGLIGKGITGFGVMGFVRGDVVMGLGLGYLGVLVWYLVRRGQRKATKSTSTTTVSASSENEKSPEKDKDVPDNDSKSETEESSPPLELTILKITSVVTWQFIFLYFCKMLPLTILIPFVICLVAGTVAYFRRKTEENYSIANLSMMATKLVCSIGGQSPRLSRSQSLTFMFSPLSSPGSAIGSPRPRTTLRDALLEQQVTEKIIPETKQSQDDTDGEGDDGSLSLDSNKFLYGVFLACCVVQIWNHPWLARTVLPIPVLYYGLKKIIRKLGILYYLKSYIRDPFIRFYNDEDNELSSSMFPPILRTFYKILSASDSKLLEFCEAYLDPVASMVILVAVILLTVLFFVFAATQVYLEGDHLVRVSIDLVNQTVSNHPEINEMLPEGWESMMSSVVDNAYVQGKEYITNIIRDSIEEKDPVKAREIEKQVIELWDRIYHAWSKTWDDFNNKSEGIGSGNGAIEWNEILVETGKSVPKMLDYSVLVEYGRANLGTLMSVSESVWNIVVGNISVAVSAVMSVVSVVLGGGSAIINLILNFAVFFTALFYLLSSSSSSANYKPIELFRSYVPVGDAKLSNKFLSAVEDAVNGVFSASFKMAAFYGMWTYLVHTIFAIKIVFVPSILAALFGAVPLLMPYWAALPAVLELSIIQGRWTSALLMMLAQMAPMSLVDTQIYSEIKGGGHPYLTGLAVAGGIFYFGIQGAIVGPVVLCCVVVTGKVGSSFLKEEQQAEPAPTGPVKASTPYPINN